MEQSDTEPRCEVCDNFRPQAPGRGAREIAFGPRRVLLCRAHAAIAANSGVTSFDDLRELYGENAGQRSYVPRRSRHANGEKGKPARSPGRRARDVRA